MVRMIGFYGSAPWTGTAVIELFTLRGMELQCNQHLFFRITGCQTNGLLAHWDHFADYLVLKNGMAPEKRSKCMKYIFHINNNLDFFSF